MVWDPFYGDVHPFFTALFTASPTILYITLYKCTHTTASQPKPHNKLKYKLRTSCNSHIYPSHLLCTSMHACILIPIPLHTPPYPISIPSIHPIHPSYPTLIRPDQTTQQRLKEARYSSFHLSFPLSHFPSLPIPFPSYSVP